MSAEERLRYHQKNSGPLMGCLKKWLRDQIEERKVEPNSGLGSDLEAARRIAAAAIPSGVPHISATRIRTADHVFSVGIDELPAWPLVVYSRKRCIDEGPADIAV
jgi:hypothetical protein